MPNNKPKTKPNSLAKPMPDLETANINDLANFDLRCKRGSGLTQKRLNQHILGRKILQFLKDAA